MPEEGVRFIPHSEMLTYEEMLHIVRLCVQKGICKVRVTGGEPLVRKGFISFLERLSASIHKYSHVSKREISKQMLTQHLVLSK